MEEFEKHMSGLTEEELQEWYGEKYGRDYITDTKTMTSAQIDEIKKLYTVDVAQSFVDVGDNDTISQSAREWLNNNTSRGVDPSAQTDDILLSLSEQDEVIQRNKDFDLENIVEKSKSSKLLSALKWLDPVEEAIAGMVTKIGLPSVAQAYVVAEAVNWFGNLTLEAARSKGELDLLNSKILTGQATDDEIKDFGKNIMSNLKQGVERAEKVSPSANVMNWIGKMLDR